MTVIMDRYSGSMLSRRKNEQPTVLFTYYVTGKGKFPFDMLRYDHAWPVDTIDAHNMTERDRRSIKMYSYRAPTIDRWSSFGWSVGNEDLML